MPLDRTDANVRGFARRIEAGMFNGGWIVTEFTNDNWITLQEEPAAYPF